jgi:hypothetical protein
VTVFLADPIMDGAILTFGLGFAVMSEFWDIDRIGAGATLTRPYDRSPRWSAAPIRVL